MKGILCLQSIDLGHSEKKNVIRVIMRTLIIIMYYQINLNMYKLYTSRHLFKRQINGLSKVSLRLQLALGTEFLERFDRSYVVDFTIIWDKPSIKHNRWVMFRLCAETRNYRFCGDYEGIIFEIYSAPLPPPPQAGWNILISVLEYSYNRNVVQI